jgi:MFS family permease
MRLVPFCKLWISSAFEGVGDEVSRVVIPIIAVSMLGAGSWEVGIINALGMSAFLVLGLPIGVWVDRRRRRKLMITADVVRALVVLSVPAAFVAGVMTIGHLLVCVALIGVADVVFTTAHGAFVPSVVGQDRISDAHARLQTAASAVAVGSPSLTGALLSVIAAPFALVTAGVSYALSAQALVSISVDEDVRRTREREDSGWRPGPACPSPCTTRCSGVYSCPECFLTLPPCSAALPWRFMPSASWDLARLSSRCSALSPPWVGSLPRSQRRPS